MRRRELGPPAGTWVYELTACPDVIVTTDAATLAGMLGSPERLLQARADSGLDSTGDEAVLLRLVRGVQIPGPGQ